MFYQRSNIQGERIWARRESHVGFLIAGRRYHKGIPDNRGCPKWDWIGN
jgi:hypothetical protein